MSKRVLVLGADRAIGRCVSTALAADPAVDCVVGGQRAGDLAAHHQLRAFAERIGAHVSAVNVADGVLLREALDGVFAVVNATALDRQGSYALARQCVQHRVHYVDVATAREHVAGIKSLSERAQTATCLLVSGANSVPAISGALVDSLTHEFDRLDEIHVALAPFGDRQPWLATARAMSACIGRPMRVRHEGRWRATYAWSEPRNVVFPAPVGRRRAYLSDVPDLELFPRRYEARTVTFRVGLPSHWSNYAIAGLGRLWRRRYLADGERRRVKLLAACDGLQGLVEKAVSIQVHVHGRRDGAHIAHAAALVARTNSEAVIASSPAVALIKRWVRDGVADSGAVPCLGLLGLEAIKAELLDHEIVLVRS